MLYDPDLQPVMRWDLAGLFCLEHNATDGLVAGLEGVKHGVIVPVPVSLMDKAGTYSFVLRVWDNHAHLHKDHQVKPALEINSDYKTPKLRLIWAPMDKTGQEFEYLVKDPNSRRIEVKGDRVCPDIPMPPDRLTSEGRRKYRRVKVLIRVYDEPHVNRKVYLKLFDPDDPSAPDHNNPKDENDPENEDYIDNNDRDSNGNFYPRGNDNLRDTFGLKEGGFVIIDSVGEQLSSTTQVITDQNGWAEVIVELSIQPGNNFKVAAVLDDPSLLDQMRVGEGSQEAALRIWLGNQKVPEDNEPDIPSGARATRLLTVWRRVWVEADMMDTPEQWPPSEAPDAIDDPSPTLETSDIILEAFETAMQEAYVKVRNYLWDPGSITWWKYVLKIDREFIPYVNEPKDYCLKGLENHPPTRISTDEEAGDFWVIYVLGVYEFGIMDRGEGRDWDPSPTDDDNDDNDENPNSENPFVGGGMTFSRDDNPQAEASVVARELIRDLCVEHRLDLSQTWISTIGHELGHHWLGQRYHNDRRDNLMGPLGPLEPRWQAIAIAEIRWADQP